MLETEHDQDKYRCAAESYPFVAEAIAGETTLKEVLDSYVDNDMARVDQSIQPFFRMLSWLSDDESYLKTLWPYIPFHDRYGDTSMYAGSIAGGAVIGGAIGALPGLIAGAAISIIMTTYVSLGEKGRKKEERESYLEPIYEDVNALDQDIGKCFIYEHFDSARPRFEQTYTALVEEEKNIVDQELYHRLESGLLDIAEHELTDYLTGLKEGKISGTVLRRDLRWHDKHGWCAVEFEMSPDEFSEEKESFYKAEESRREGPANFISAELEDLLCGWPDNRLTIVEIFGKDRKASKLMDDYHEELRDWYRAQEDEYLQEIADRI